MLHSHAFLVKFTQSIHVRTREGCMIEAMHLRMFGPWHALQLLVAGPTIERI
jgi:hypothetical protein